jgi:hypothetical protein
LIDGSEKKVMKGESKDAKRYERNAKTGRK